MDFDGPWAPSVETLCTDQIPTGDSFINFKEDGVMQKQSDKRLQALKEKAILLFYYIAIRTGNLSSQPPGPASVWIKSDQRDPVESGVRVSSGSSWIRDILMPEPGVSLRASSFRTFS